MAFLGENRMSLFRRLAAKCRSHRFSFPVLPLLFSVLFYLPLLTSTFLFLFLFLIFLFLFLFIRESTLCLFDHCHSHSQSLLVLFRFRIVVSENQHHQQLPPSMVMQTDRYERLLRRAKSEDLSEVSGIGCLYQSGHDRYGRPIVVFVGKWFRFSDINLDKAMLYLIYLLDPLVKNDYVIAYFHTLTSNGNHPSFSWLKEVYNVLPYKYKKNLKAFYIIHPTIWTKMMTWWFTTFMAPAIKQKVYNMAGVEYLYSTISPQQLEIPAYITEYDMAINGLHYAPKTEGPA